MFYLLFKIFIRFIFRFDIKTAYQVAVVAVPVVARLPQVDIQCSKTMLPNCAPWIPSGSTTSFQGTLEYISIRATLKFTYLLN
jgi:hypothetical protein